jgi:hypothetical protein
VGEFIFSFHGDNSGGFGAFRTDFVGHKEVSPSNVFESRRFRENYRAALLVLRLIARHQRIAVVGDDDQSIFSFKGANSGAFRKDFRGYKEVSLLMSQASILVFNNLLQFISNGSVVRACSGCSSLLGVGGFTLVVSGGDKPMVVVVKWW